MRTDDDRQPAPSGTGRWYVTVDDLVGGWCLLTVNLPGLHAHDYRVHGPVVAAFMDEQTAHHIAGLHNERLAATAGEQEGGR